MSRAERRRQSKDDEKLLIHGVSPESTDPGQTVAMCRQLYSLIDVAKRTGNLDPVVIYLESKVDATVRGLRDVPVSCKKGCSYCCNIWVSATAPEIFRIAKIIRRRGEVAIEKVREANRFTAPFEFEIRDQHPHPCPMLVDDLCSIYRERPKSCRMAASFDAEICARSYLNVTNEDIPTPAIYMMGRTVYALAFACALDHAGLSAEAYEFNGALARALDRSDAEKAWLAGEEVFEGVHRDPGGILDTPQAAMLSELTFGVGLPSPVMMR